MAKNYKLVTQITTSKNATVHMVSTPSGMISCKSDMLSKRGINLEKGEVFKFTEPTLAVIESHKKGDYLFGGNGEATQDSSRTKLQAGLVTADHEDANNPAYIVGDKPTWNEDGERVISFMTFADYKAMRELESMEKSFATA